MRVKVRYIAAALLVLAAVAVTPGCIEAAYAARGYRAYGGEYLVIPLGALAGYAVLKAGKAWERHARRRRKLLRLEVQGKTVYGIWG